MISIGVLTPHAAAGAEAELPAMAGAQVVTWLSRIMEAGTEASAPATPPTTLPATPPTTPSGLRALTAPSVLDSAAAALASVPVDVIGYASTSTGYAIGFDAEVAMLERLSLRWSLPVAGTSLAAVAALRALGAHRVALVHPPWFDDELNDLGAAYFGSQGFEVVSARSADLVNDPRRIEPVAIIQWISRHLSDDAEAVFVGGNGFRAFQTIEELEERSGRPVIESNQVLLWSILAKVDADFSVRGHGRLFGYRPSGSF
jgi:maleate isomerase